MLTSSEKTKITIFMCFGTLMFFGPAWIAWRNLARGRADRRGAMRLSVGIFCAHMLLWIFRGHFTASFGEFALFVLALAAALFNAALIWTLYLALEPYVRRHWPHSIISWTRLLDGRLRDPSVGRDALLGVVLGILWILIFTIGTAIKHTLGAEPSFSNNTDYLLGARSTLGAWLIQVPGSVRATLMFFFLLFIFRVVLRNKWAAAAVFVALWTLLQSLGSTHPAIDIPASIAVYAIAAVALVRFGLVTLAVAVFTADSMGNLSLSTNPSIWYFGSTVFVVATVVLLAAWAFQSATAGRKLFAAELFE
jgi:hypothetical protein